jgi:hypothetical protein
MPDTPPPAPGPAPPPFHFPFAEAQTLLARLHDLVDDLDAIRRKHDAAVGPMRVDFEGSSRRNFDSRFDQEMNDLAARQTDLGHDIDDLQRAVAEAHRRQDEYVRAMAAWTQASQAYSSYQQAHPAPAGAGRAR